MSADSKAPIIIKRKKVIAGGHHGGAWKVAYADFVTAMMAFFLLMWLLGATNEKQRKGIADYFNPTIPINKVSGGGDGAFGGDSVFAETSLARTGTGASTVHATDDAGAKGNTGFDAGESDTEKARDEESEEMGELQDILTGRGGESMVSDLLARHIVTKLSDEGLIVEVFDLPGAPLFRDDSTPTEALIGVLESVAEVFSLSSNDIAVQAHTASVPLVTRENPVWRLSAARANAARAKLEEIGVDSDRLQRVTGFADNQPVTRDPLSARNNRVEFILLRRKL